MIERVIILDAVDPVAFYGVNNANVQLIKNLFPKVRIAARGNVMKVIGDEKETEVFEEKIKLLEKHCAEYNQLSEEVIIDIIKGDEPQAIKPQENLIIYGVNGKPITGRTPNQKKLVEAFAKNDLTFALGPAGSGKTYVAIALAVKALKNKEVKKIILSRPAVEAGENRSLSATVVRCFAGYDSGSEAERVHGDERDTNRSVGIYEGAYVERCGDYSR